MKPFAPSEEKFRNLLSLIARLRGPEGCPWDRVQQKVDIGRYLIEEAYEVIEALDGSPDHLREELGDLLFQILFLARMAEEAGEFTAFDILEEITAKMVRRHPHVFGNTKADSIEEVRINWERIKAEIELKGTKADSLTAGIPRSLTTLAKTQRITAKASAAGFDWPDTEGVLEKVEEELAEFRAALKTNQPQRLQEEAGDLIFTLVNLCRFVRVDAEAALRSSLHKFTYRFSLMERKLAADGKVTRDASQAELDRFWEQTKTEEGNP